jgi:hypothetical protein
VEKSSTKTYVRALKAGFEGDDSNYAVQIGHWKKYWKATVMIVFVEYDSKPTQPLASKDKPLSAAQGADRVRDRFNRWSIRLC